jgi:cyclophilin family peptidyl-prolyl cis-trans isomerase
MTTSARFVALTSITSITIALTLGACSRQSGNKSVDAPGEAASKVVVAQPTGNQRPTVDPAALFTPFNQAVRLDPPDDELRPPDVTAGGKVTAKLFEQIAGKDGTCGLWDEVKFVDATGKHVKQFALMKTDAGDVRIELFHESAPNHVRSFICLARAGYFDGLPFHASVRRGDKETLQGYLEAGCPKGTGEIGCGSIGYWLKPEVNDKLSHEEGTVGAWHPGEIERAACRFYITLGRNPALDGNYTIFGKVVHGLDVLHTINKRPIQDEAHKGPRLEPHRIQQVVIESRQE